MLNKKRALNIIFSQNTLFIIINLFVHAINFLRSFLFMRVLDLADLGMISLVQTCIMFIGFMHFGFFQGGYRLIAYKHDESDQVNNIVFSFLGCLGVLLIAFALIFPVTGIDFIIGNQYLLLSVIAGIFTLATTWLTNTMTVKKMIPEINQIFAISGIVSIALIALVFVWGTFGGILSIMIQPVVFVTLALLRCKVFFQEDSQKHNPIRFCAILRGDIFNIEYTNREVEHSLPAQRRRLGQVLSCVRVLIIVCIDSHVNPISLFPENNQCLRTRPVTRIQQAKPKLHTRAGGLRRGYIIGGTHAVSTHSRCIVPYALRKHQVCVYAVTWFYLQSAILLGFIDTERLARLQVAAAVGKHRSGGLDSHHLCDGKNGCFQFGHNGNYKKHIIYAANAVWRNIHFYPS